MYHSQEMYVCVCHRFKNNITFKCCCIKLLNAISENVLFDVRVSFVFPLNKYTLMAHI